jgi:hypothetical protein
MNIPKYNLNKDEYNNRDLYYKKKIHRTIKEKIINMILQFLCIHIK